MRLHCDAAIRCSKRSELVGSRHLLCCEGSNEAARVHHRSRRRGGCVAAGWSRAADGKNLSGRTDRHHVPCLRNGIGPDPIHPLVRTFVHTLRALGYVEGQNLVLERRSAEGKFERFGEIAADLIRHGIDVIVVTNILVAKEMIRVTNTVPIVMASSIERVGAGVVTSLARPGGNITGFTSNAGPEIEAKRLELLKEVLPQASRVAFLGLKSDWEGPEAEGIRVAARMMGVTLVHAEHTSTNYADAFALITRDRAEALFVASQAASYANRQVIVDFALERRIPGIYPWREFIEGGGLMSLGEPS